MRLVILDDYDQVSEWAAKYVRNKILKFNPGPDKFFVLGLPTGIFGIIYYIAELVCGERKHLIAFLSSPNFAI